MNASPCWHLHEAVALTVLLSAMRHAYRRVCKSVDALDCLQVTSPRHSLIARTVLAIPGHARRQVPSGAALTASSQSDLVYK